MENIINEIKDSILNLDFNKYVNNMMQFTSKVLIIENQQIPIYDFLQLENYRHYTMSLDEDFLILFKFISLRLEKNIDCKIFNWSTPIDNNNSLLNKILKKGVADNHVHLWSAIPLFKITWEFFMNNVCEDILLIPIKENIACNDINSEEILKASIIRLYFYFKINGKNNKSDEYDKFESYIYSMTNKLIKNNINFDVEKKKIQKVINFLLKRKEFNSKIYSDYMMNLSNQNESKNYVMERWFLYTVILDLIKGKENSKDKFLLITYIKIKEEFRSRITQTIGSNGFNSFQKINRNKKRIMELYGDFEKLLNPYISEIVENNEIKKLEVRVKIKDTAEETAKYIEYINNNIGEDIKRKNIINYILYFSRKYEETNEQDEVYRDEIKRRVIDIENEILNSFFSKFIISKKIVALDVCSREKNYKPEVYSKIYNSSEYIYNCKLKKTYHVGEEYVDFLDGLRAIDEAIEYLGLNKGDRLSHALPLEQDVYKWYKEKDYIIETSIENYLDNITWLFFNLSKEIVSHDFLENLKLEFYRIFNILYVKNLDIEDMSNIENKQMRAFCKTMINLKHMTYDISDFYKAWKKRKEDPEKLIDELLESESEKKELFLCINYFFNEKIRKKGKNPIKKKINKEEISIIKTIQEKIRNKIVEKEIYVESCPSSNIFLGEIKEYSEHPIVNMFFREKNQNENFNQEIISSINTDDAGIFSTSIKNEYSIVAYSIKKKMESYGHEKVDEKEIYKWIDKIRKNSIKMVFK